MRSSDPGCFAVGYLRDGVLSPVSVTPNLRMLTWGYLACQLFGRRDLRFAPAHLYVEFANPANPEDEITFDPPQSDDSLDYYSSLGNSPDRDFLRVPLPPAAEIQVDPDYANLLPPDRGNRLRFLAQVAAGAVGVFGKPFSEVNNSRVYGVALVASPSPGDWTSDILFSRGYYAPEEQIPKMANLQVGIAYATTFGTA